MRRSSWKVGFKVSVRLDGVVDHLGIRIFLWRRPDGEAEFAAGFEDAECFSTSALRVRHVKQGEVGQNAIESRIGERQILRVALLKLDLRKHFLRDGDHFPGKIETARSCA